MTVFLKSVVLAFLYTDTSTGLSGSQYKFRGPHGNETAFQRIFREIQWELWRPCPEKLL
jgi:hypothetical protein